MGWVVDHACRRWGLLEDGQHSTPQIATPAPHTSLLPGKRGRSVYSSAMMAPSANMSMGAL